MTHTRTHTLHTYVRKPGIVIIHTPALRVPMEDECSRLGNGSPAVSSATQPAQQPSHESCSRPRHPRSCRFSFSEPFGRQAHGSQPGTQARRHAQGHVMSFRFLTISPPKRRSRGLPCQSLPRTAFPDLPALLPCVSTIDPMRRAREPGSSS